MTDLAYRQDLCAYWRTDDDRQAAEPRLGWLALAASSRNAADHPPRWPRWLLEFEQVIGPLTDPPRYGGKAQGRPPHADLRYWNETRPGRSVRGLGAPRPVR
jgi:hypothetical protein